MTKSIAAPISFSDRIMTLIKQGYWIPTGATRPVKKLVDKEIHSKKYTFWIRKDSELAEYDYIICPHCRGRINLSYDASRSEEEATAIMSGFCNCLSPYRL